MFPFPSTTRPLLAEIYDYKQVCFKRYSLASLELFSAYLERSRGILNITQIYPDDIRGFMDARLKIEKPRTVAKRYWALKVFFDYLVEKFREDYFKLPFKGVRPPELPTLRPKDLKESDIERLKEVLKNIPDRAERITTQLMFNLLIGSALRSQDLISITPGHIDFTSGTVGGLKRKGRFFGEIVLNDATLKLLVLYLPIRERMLTTSGPFRWSSLPKSIQDKYPLFPSVYGAKLKDRLDPEQFQISNKTVWSRITKVLRQAGIDANPHRTRHTSAHKFLGLTKDLLLLKQFGGWKDVQSATTYTIRGPEAIRAITNLAEFQL